MPVPLPQPVLALPRGFYMAETEVTYELWNAVRTWATDAARGMSRYTFDNLGRQGGDRNSGQHGCWYEPTSCDNH